MSSCVCVINLCILVPACSVSCRLVYSLLPGVSCLCVSLTMSCPALSCPDVIIKDYYLSLLLVCVFLVSPCCVHRDRRPDLKSKRRPLTSFCFPFSKVFLFCSCLFCLSRQGSHHSSFRPSPRDCRECCESAGREPSCPPIAGDIRRRLWLSQARRLVV